MDPGNLLTQRLPEDVCDIGTAELMLATVIPALWRSQQEILGVKPVLTIFPELAIDFRKLLLKAWARYIVFLAASECSWY